jgi:hypothetical protein
MECVVDSHVWFPYVGCEVQVVDGAIRVASFLQMPTVVKEVSVPVPILVHRVL